VFVGDAAHAPSLHVVQPARLIQRSVAHAVAMRGARCTLALDAGQSLL
jgi:hypothetical protein